MIRFKESLFRMPVTDEEGTPVGHVEDLAFAFGEASPTVEALAVELPWTDRVGSCRLVRPVDDVVLLFPWSQVAMIEEDRIVLAGHHPAFDVISAEGLLLVRQDVIDKQIVDDEGNRLQRVDDVILAREGSTLRVDMLYLGMTWLPTSVHLKEVLQRLTRQARASEEVDEIPWQLVGDVDRDADVLTLKPLD